MALVMGGAEKDERHAKSGGLVGGLGLGILHPAKPFGDLLQSRDGVGTAELPMLAIINDISAGPS